jgi:RimJ/RimL family protein N-acetyltransferase
MWYGKAADGTPLHVGYDPRSAVNTNEESWNSIFNNGERIIKSVYAHSYGHIGETQILINHPLKEAELFILIGNPAAQGHHYAQMAVLQFLDIAFVELDLHRIWVDVPDYNHIAMNLFKRLCFTIEGSLRSTHFLNGEWKNSTVMGLLEDEYRRRRTGMWDNLIVVDN